MILNAKIGGLWFFCDFGPRDTFQERIVPKAIEKNIEKLHMKFLTLNVDFNKQSLIFLVQGNLCMRASNSGSPLKVVILPLLASLS